MEPPLQARTTQPQRATLVFAPGETKKTIDVSIVVDELLEADEFFTVSLSNPEGGYLRDNLQEAIGTIRNDDQTLGISNAGYTTPDPIRA